jgi:tetratricopeptide (TPR) repeat protein
VKVFLFLLAILLLPPALAQAPAKASDLLGTDPIGYLLARTNLLEGTEPQEAMRLAKEGLLVARRQKDTEKEAAFLSSVAFCSTQTGDLAQAVQYGHEALALSTRLGNRERMAKAHNILGITYTFMGSYSRALDEGLEALRIRQQLGLEAATLQSLNLVGVIYHRSGQYKKAIEYYQTILEQSSKAPATPRFILANLNIGFAKYKLGLFSEALEHHLLALATAKQIQDTTYLNYAYFNIGLTYTDLQNYPEATRFLQLALAGYRAHDQKFALAQVLNALGRLDLLTGESERGVRWTLEGASLAEAIKAKDELKMSYELLSALYEKRGDHAKALKFYKLYAQTKDSIFSNQESEKIADIAMKVVTLKKDYEIGSLKKEQVISSLKLQKERYFTFILASSVLTLSLFILVLIRYGTKTRGSKLLLQTTNLKLQILNTELQETLREVRTLSGLLPICAKCKKIRDDDGYWQQLEGYISKHTSATFSHGICPPCAEELYPEMIDSLRSWHDRTSVGPDVAEAAPDL